jgi:hypothetical protein
MQRFIWKNLSAGAARLLSPKSQVFKNARLNRAASSSVSRRCALQEGDARAG